MWFLYIHGYSHRQEVFVQLVCAAVSYAVAIVVTAMAARSLLIIW